jgi:hypothetical protein
MAPTLSNLIANPLPKPGITFKSRSRSRGLRKMVFVFMDIAKRFQ